MFRKLLIANRGEIALRIQRTARRLGIPTVSVASDADLTALHAREADELVRIGPAPPRESYLSISRLIEAAKASGAEAVHPGYGFLSENAAFAEACAEAGLTFVGPAPETIRAMGAKDEAKALAQAAGVPVVPGYRADGPDDGRAERWVKEANTLGFPLLVKAVVGGGGRGMRAVHTPDTLLDAIDTARREAMSAFDDGRLMLEKLIEHPRHVEVQVFGDRHGHVVHMFERDCSLQRRHQKVIEEAPAPGLPEPLRETMLDAAVELARSVDYLGAGTVEFLVPASLDAAYFIEMNTRLQVEHTVTEAITGLDLVEWQLRVAAGERLPITEQNQIVASGHAVEARIYAEDPSEGFRPQSGRILSYEVPGDRVGSLRTDSGLTAGDSISPFYDPMIAKWIGTGDDREAAFAVLEGALAEARIQGLKTNLAFLLALVRHCDVRAANLDTGLIDRNLTTLLIPFDRTAAAVAGMSALVSHERASSRDTADTGLGPWAANDGFGLIPVRAVPRTLDVDGTLQAVHFHTDWRARSGGTLTLEIDGAHHELVASEAIVDPSRPDELCVWQDHQDVRVAWARWQLDDTGTGSGEARAPMNAKVTAVRVAPGDVVAEGDPLVVVEAMKMEHVLTADVAGTVESVIAVVGNQVGTGDVLVTVSATARDAD